MSAEGFTDDERQAIRDRAKELRSGSKDSEGEVIANIAEMPKADREIAERLHAVIMKNAPKLTPKLWYGSPAYARGKDVVCFFQAASKYDTRYLTFGFNDSANLDDDSMWPTAYGIAKLTKADEETIGDLVRKAVS
jgi:uncharacterized protein YdhG (YjbR/CyaY superfamily)